MVYFGIFAVITKSKILPMGKELQSTGLGGFAVQVDLDRVQRNAIAAQRVDAAITRKSRKRTTGNQ